MGRIIFVTGTDTGAGKTLFTALLLAHLRRRGLDALAMKPFCSGTRADVRLLSEIQKNTVPLERVNPLFFREAVAPAVALRKHSRKIRKQEAIERVQALADCCDYLLVEGSGGIMVPLAQDFLVIDLISALRCPAIVVARNRLGAINHSLLTLRVLQSMEVSIVALVLMGTPTQNLATRTNATIISELASPLPVFEVPFLGPHADRVLRVESSEKKLKNVLARIWDLATLSPAC